MIEIVLLGAPRGKERPRTTRDSQRMYTPDKTARYEERLSNMAQQVMGDKPLLEGPLAVELDIRLPITASWPKKRQDAARRGIERPTKKPDWDNFAKILDALNLIVWVDDSQIVDGRVRKSYSDKPGTWITVYPLEELFS